MKPDGNRSSDAAYALDDIYFWSCVRIIRECDDCMNLRRCSDPLHILAKEELADIALREFERMYPPRFKFADDEAAARNGLFLRYSYTSCTRASFAVGITGS